MSRRLKDWFIPHAENRYEPRFLRAGSVLTIAFVVAVLFAGASYVGRAVLTDSNLAAVISSVLVDLTNADRSGNKIGTLSMNPLLAKAAQMKANDMAAKGYFAHNSPDGKTPWEWFKKAGYPFAYAGENLAVYFSDSADVERAWMNSPLHRANILNTRFTEIGIATAEGVYQGVPTVFVVQMFGHPAVSIQKKAPATSTPHVASVQPVPPRPIPREEAPKVRGISTSTTDDGLEIITMDDAFIAVKNAVPVATASVEEGMEHSSFWERLLASPKTSLGYVYSGIGVLVLIAMVLLIFIEMREQRPKNIFYATLLICLMVVFLLLLALALPSAVVK